MHSATETIFNENWSILVDKYNDKDIVISYLQDTWLIWKEYFIKAWIDKHLHLENIVTSRAERAYTMIKKYLRISTGDLQAVY